MLRSCGSAPAVARRAGRGGGSSRSSSRSSARASAFSLTSACFSRRTISIAAADEVAHDRVDVAADVADLGELARLDLDEGAARELREPARDLGLADAGRPDHQDVLGRDVGGHLGREPPPAHAAAQRDRHRALGGVPGRPRSGRARSRSRAATAPRGRGARAAARSSWRRASPPRPGRSCRCRSRPRCAAPRVRSRARRARAAWRTSARAAASASGPPLPTATIPSSGAITSPAPESRNVASRSATTRNASSRRRARSVRHSFASSTAARCRLPRNSSSRASKRWISASASAVEPAKPASTCRCAAAGPCARGA